MRKLKEIASWLLALTMGVAAFIVVANFIPPPEGHVTFDSGVENDSEYVITYRYPNGNTGTLSHDPITKEKGRVIDRETARKLNELP